MILFPEQTAETNVNPAGPARAYGHEIPFWS
jgi:hypothetical protein